MIQDSINQLLGMAGIAGGYLAKTKSDILQPELDAAINRKSESIANATNVSELGSSPKAQIKGRATMPLSAQIKAKVGEKKLAEEYYDKLDALKKQGNANVEKNVKPMQPPTPGDMETYPAEPEGMTIEGIKGMLKESAQLTPQEQARALAMSQMQAQGQSLVSQSNGFAELKERIKNSPRHGKGQFIKSLKNQVTDLEKKENK